MKYIPTAGPYAGLRGNLIEKRADGSLVIEFPIGTFTSGGAAPTSPAVFDARWVRVEYSEQLTSYFAVVDALREDRRRADWKPEYDRIILAKLEDMYEGLDPAERDEVERQGHRAWPDLWDQQSATCGLTKDQRNEE